MPIVQRLTFGVPQMASTSEAKPRRAARVKDSVAVCSKLAPDLFELVKRHADEHHMFPSGAVNDCLRRYFNLPPLD